MKQNDHLKFWLLLFLLLILVGGGLVYWKKNREYKMAMALQAAVDVGSPGATGATSAWDHTTQTQDHTSIDCPGDEDCAEEEILCPYPAPYNPVERVLATCFTSIKFTLQARGFNKQWDVWMWTMPGVEVTQVDWETTTTPDFIDGAFELCVCEGGMLFIRRKQ
jgi:hypothetical protein